MYRYPLRKRSLKMDVVISKHPTLREMLRRYIETGEVSELLTKVSDSYDFSDESQIDMDADLKRSADISDFIARHEEPAVVPDHPDSSTEPSSDPAPQAPIQEPSSE